MTYLQHLFIGTILLLFSLSSCHISSPTQSISPEVIAIYPSSDTLPENLLRMYLLFSSPMKTVGNVEHIRLFDAEGQEVHGAIFQGAYELWDLKQQQLTILFDPARVKKGLIAHEQLGRALKAGATFTLQIDPLEDVTHRPLVKTYIKSFYITHPDTLAPNVDTWKLTKPDIYTCSPLVLTFPDMLDQFSLLQRIVVTDVDTIKVAGNKRLGTNEKAWIFTPLQAWGPGLYHICINTRLEDPAGNNLNGLFDHKAGSLKYRKEGETIFRSFDLPSDP